MTSAVFLLLFYRLFSLSLLLGGFPRFHFPCRILLDILRHPILEMRPMILQSRVSLARFNHLISSHDEPIMTTTELSFIAAR